MALWKLERTMGVGYDEHDSLIIRAKTEEEARAFAIDHYYGFLNKVACEAIDPEGKTEVVHESFCAG